MKAENKLLRENLKRMSENVNILIEKMNQEQSRKKIVHGQNSSLQLSDGGDVPGRSQSPGVRQPSITMDSRADSLQYADKATLSLMKEHDKLKKRLKQIMQPDFLVNLKRDLRVTEEEIKQ